jgi:hypothetical protein
VNLLWHRRPWRRSTFVDAPTAYGQIQIRWKRMNETDQIKIPSNINKWVMDINFIPIQSWRARHPDKMDIKRIKNWFWVNE